MILTISQVFFNFFLFFDEDLHFSLRKHDGKCCPFEDVSLKERDLTPKFRCGIIHKYSLMPVNKRKHSRVPIRFGVLPEAKMTLYKPFYHEPFDVHIQDMSAGGMKLSSPELLPLYFEFGL